MCVVPGDSGFLGLQTLPGVSLTRRPECEPSRDRKRADVVRGIASCGPPLLTGRPKKTCELYNLHLLGRLRSRQEGSVRQKEAC
jgi:hypothetical protein